MVDMGNRRDPELYRDTVTLLETHSAWERTETSPTVDAAVTQAANSALGELFYQHHMIDAWLHIRMPNQRGQGLVDGLLNQPLDPMVTGTGDPDSFTAALSRAHRRIAETHGTAYTEAHADPALILTLAVPGDYDALRWQDTIEQVTTIADTVDCLHTAITESLQAFNATTG